MPETLAIHLRGVRVHNLKGVDADIPLRRLTVFTGVSGSGKSSLAFDTLYAEAQRRYLQSFSVSTRQFLEHLDKPDADRIDNLPPAIAVAQRAFPRGPRATVGTVTEITEYLRLLFARAATIYCLRCGQEVRSHTAADVADAAARLPAGTRFSVAFPAPPPPDGDPASWMTGLREEGFLRVQVGNQVFRLDDTPPPDVTPADGIWVLVDRLEAGRAPRERLTDSVETAFAKGRGRMALVTDQDDLLFDQRSVCPHCDIEYPPLEPRLFSFNDPRGACPACEGTGLRKSPGRRTGKKADKDPGATTDEPPKSESAAPELPTELCPECRGSRYSEWALCARLGGKNIAEWSALMAADLAAFCAALELPPQRQAAGRLLLDQVRTRLAYLAELDLGYLTLDRPARTLSTGEAQRLRLTTALASSLAGALYVLDEPTVGLHPRDTDRLLNILLRLRNSGNTLVLVEHDAEIIRAADHVVDIGPEAGEQGGEVLYQGPPAGLLDRADSFTANYLSGRSRIDVPRHRRPANHGHLRLVHARTHNLQDLTVDFPLGVLCVVTGVSGAGKSSLVEDTFYPALSRRKGKKGSGLISETDVIGSGQVGDVVLMDQSPLPRTARSNPVTYIKAMGDIRKLFAETSEARIRNFGPGAFSFNQSGGRCDTCEGQGTLDIDMQFLADVTVTCPDCKGTRFKRDILDVRVRSLNIAEILALTVREAFRFFRAQPAIERRLKLLIDVGLEYIRLGQPADTLSGGEAQRLKLAGHLAASRKPRCLFLLDEPTAGLHPADVAHLLDCFHRLLQMGHSLIVVEHDLDVIKCADHVIDLGPGAAAAGGQVVAAGTPEEVAAVPASFTGQWLRRVLP
jgi:excinuclease ABC subunit A